MYRKEVWEKGVETVTKENVCVHRATGGYYRSDTAIVATLRLTGEGIREVRQSGHLVQIDWERRKQSVSSLDTQKEMRSGTLTNY